ncbi:HAMP domain-containing sensor histidine kinase [Rhodococcus sp. X156]|uniref:HAMP domain-containing sensor histidine kinase n=1 Tax=Rhodococcus sp. X156 TaxID=2499145 RepID=UPI000FDA2666|nr:HAMP domain-containing sensor histidine kinase [Rhodococcus sp. X156]
MRAPMPLTRSMSLRARVTMLAAVVVAVAVALMATSAYFVVSNALYDDVDNQLRNRATTVLNSNLLESISQENLQIATLFSSGVRVSVILPSGAVAYSGRGAPVGKPELDVAMGVSAESLRTTEDYRVLAQRAPNGTTLVLAQSLAPTRLVLHNLAVVLFTVGGAGILVAVVAGAAVGRAGLRPVARLNEAAQRVARTDELTPIPVTGDDELASLTRSFNAMLLSLEESRDRQRRLVADAGHELRTPLTSLRTNMELLMASSAPGAPQLGETDRAELHADVVAQLEELSTLVGDLVELAREDAPQVVQLPLNLAEVVEEALERARRRRSEITFTAWLQPWYLVGDPTALERAVLNVLDNAAKWSPAGERVEVVMTQVDPTHVEVVVSDAGTGIAPEDRALVFERFYRSTGSRSMPGSGLGLAIVKQVALRHQGAVWAEESDRGGARVRLRLPGSPRPLTDA